MEHPVNVVKHGSCGVVVSPGKKKYPVLVAKIAALIKTV
jgi:hypothetical protein